MNRFKKTRLQIQSDVQEVFNQVKSEVEKSYFSREPQIDRAKKLVSVYVPKVVSSKNSLLVDTLINYLTNEGRRLMEGRSSRSINAFYDWNQGLADRLKQGIPSYHTSLSLSSDSRVLYSSAGGLLGTFLVGSLIRVVSPWFIVDILSALIAFPAAYYCIYAFTTQLTLKKLQEDVNDYLKEEENNTLQWLIGNVDNYSDKFNSFLNSQSD